MCHQRSQFGKSIKYKATPEKSRHAKAKPYVRSRNKDYYVEDRDED